jgi:uncharacterized membrane protein
MNITTNRVEAFSDGVIAIVITIMVFDIKISDNIRLSNKRELKELIGLIPQLIAYLSSFIVLGIMWLNHHHLFHLIRKVDERFMWLNLHLLFWLSLIPFPTDMLGRDPFLSYSAAIYGVIMFMSLLAFTMLRGYAIRKNLMYGEEDRLLNTTIKRVNKRARIKNYLGLLAYIVSIPAAFWSLYAAYACFAVPPILFFIPDGIDNEKLADIIIDNNENAASDPQL